MHLSNYKKIATALIALFVMGNMCHAQDLLSSRNLRSGFAVNNQQGAKARKGTPRVVATASESEEGTPTSFMLVGSGYNASGIFTPDLNTVPIPPIR